MILDDGGRGILERADVCIVGAGPVGIALALECERRGLSVTLLESGSDGFDADAQALSTMEIVDPRHHAPSDLAIRRALGGTSLIWCGRCVPYDDIDFKRREHVAEFWLANQTPRHCPLLCHCHHGPDETAVAGQAEPTRLRQAGLQSAGRG